MYTPAAGWHPDPTGRHEHRYWDGIDWTDDVADQGITGVDPVRGTPPAGAFGQYPSVPPPASGSRTGMIALVVGLALVGAVVVVGGAVALLSAGEADDSTSAATTVPPGDTTAPAGEATTTTPTATTPTTVPPTTAGGPHDVNVFTLEVGDCLVEETREETIFELPIVTCDQPHTSEIFYSHTIATPSLPSGSEMEALVEAECISRFEGFVGIPYPDSNLLVTWIEPTASSWNAGDRELLCLASGPPGEVVGTLAGSNR